MPRYPDQTVAVRLVRRDDAAVLARLLRDNREHLAPFDPDRPPGYATLEGQQQEIAAVLALNDEGRVYPAVIELDGRVVGRVTLSNLVHGAAMSAELGYWVDARVTGRGVATLAVRDVLVLAFTVLGLHRVQAGTLVHNTASQTVLERNGFERIGLARGYLRIAGRWQDHLLWQRLANEGP